MKKFGKKQGTKGARKKIAKDTIFEVQGIKILALLL